MRAQLCDHQVPGDQAARCSGCSNWLRLIVAHITSRLCLPKCRAHVGDASGHVSLSNEGLGIGIASWEGGCAADFPSAFQIASADLALPGFAEVGSSISARHAIACSWMAAQPPLPEPFTEPAVTR